MKNLVIALDNMTKEKIRDFVFNVSNCINSDQVVYKVNDLLALVGFEGLSQLFNDTKAFFMLDGKYHDIENTLKNYLIQLKNSKFADKVKFLTVHASNGEKALNSLVETKNKLGLNNLKILGITALTSLDSNDTEEIYGDDSIHSVLKLANIAYKAGLDGVVCSSWESEIVKEVFGKEFITMTPGIRPEKIENDDQKRIKTPKQAIESGADNIVVGRPITQSKEPLLVIEKILEQINNAKYISSGKYNFEKVFYRGTWEDILKYIGVIYIRPENGKYCKLASGLYSNAYINIGILERYPRILQKIAIELRKKLINSGIFLEDKLDEYVIMGAQMGSVRISSYLSFVLGINGQSIYTEKDGDEMKLKRHNIDLKGKKVILSEDIITKGHTLKKMINLVKDRGGEVIGITCVGNRYGKDFFEGIPLLYCYKPPVFELYYDDDTPEENRGNYPKLPKGATISIKPKNEWNDLVKSMR